VLKGFTTTSGYSGMSRDAQFTAVLQRSTQHDQAATDVQKRVNWIRWADHCMIQVLTFK